MMRCEVLTLFPELIEAVVSRSILKRAQEKGYVQIRARNIRDFCSDPHRTADDAPYGGGGGMVMKAEPIFRALEALRREYSRMRLIVPSPQGQPFSHDLAKDLSQESRPVVWLCGHYEGIDERVTIKFHPEEISIGDYVVTGGELPTLVMIDAAVRLIPGVLGHPTSAEEDSFAKTLLDYPHYTRPVRIEGLSVPSVLLSGNHEAIRRWRRKEALRNTVYKRPDLISPELLSAQDQQFLAEIVEEHSQSLTKGSRKEVCS